MKAYIDFSAVPPVWGNPDWARRKLLSRVEIDNAIAVPADNDVAGWEEFDQRMQQAEIYAAERPDFDPQTQLLLDPQRNSETGVITWEVATKPLEMIVPTMVTMRQARLILLQTGLLDQVTAAIESLGAAAKITWEYSQEVQRSNPLIDSVATIAGMTMEEIDQMFIAASKL